jgi:ligand-binding sensor domain-containing protein
MKKISVILAFVLFVFASCKKDPPPVEIPKSLPDNYVSSIFIDSNGLKYFATKKGLASFDGTKWTVFHDNPKVTIKAIHAIAFEQSTYGPEVWLGTDAGVGVAQLPIDAVSGATTYTKSNTASLFPGQPGLKGDKVTVVKVDQKQIRWFGTNEGLSAFRGNNWPTISLGNHYNANFFKTNLVTSVEGSNDTIYIGTLGGGVARFLTSNVDAITAASPYEIPWSMLPSDNVKAVFIDGNVQWYGTDEGIGKHTGTRAKENWVIYDTSDGLIHNDVQCIVKDNTGKMWFGTKGGLSSFDGSKWANYTTGNGLVSNNVLCLAIAKDGSLWVGTDNGVSHFNGNAWKNYKADQ